MKDFYKKYLVTQYTSWIQKGNFLHLHLFHFVFLATIWLAWDKKLMPLRFEVPVCNIFLAKVFNDQVCYEMDLNLFKDEDDIENQLKDGITLILDPNEERQFEKNSINEESEMEIRNYFHNAKDNSVQVHLESIGKQIF